MFQTAVPWCNLAGGPTISATGPTLVSMASQTSGDPDTPREWLSLEDPEEQRTWLFDLTFLTSSYRCIYGAGCPGTGGTEQAEALGCCDHGAYFSEDEDPSGVIATLESLGSEHWQMKERAEELGGPVYTDEEGYQRTRVVDGACIVLNRADSPTGPGCALHQEALRRDVAHLQLKPEVCWQVPIRREDSVEESGHVVSAVREWRRRDWGEGGEEFHWWCTEEPEPFEGTEPLYESMRAELTAMVGEAVYSELVDHIRSRQGLAFLPHPSLRHRSNQ